MKYLSRCLAGLVENKEFHFHPKCAKVRITHISFADDLLLFTRGDLPSVKALYACFTEFSKSSGLQANLGKSSVYFGGVSQSIQHDILQHLGFAKKLSYASRVQLVQTVTFGIQAYWAQLFVIPAKILKVIDGYCRSYVWSGANEITKKSLVAWTRICMPKSTGGLNLVNLQLWNKAAIAKTYWDLARKQDKLWIRWIHAYYTKGATIQDIPIPKQSCWMVRMIFAARDTLAPLMDHIKPEKSIIRQIYLQLLGDNPPMRWKSLMFKNYARPKAIFTMWLHLHVWTERNLRIFEQRFRDWDSIAREVASVSSVRAPPGLQQAMHSYRL
ncbi:uncharacterized protein LOC132057530 [Lycium ferocissimum]|uniref:uncharacterized protein LOC132057530 n=1 Tax=Lycium ferocissimum TaxID=112874 RepID=UPI002815EB20|nr:uncharacterized protein LOC132057530 [Lycium ferocissimum]